MRSETSGGGGAARPTTGLAQESISAADAARIEDMEFASSRRTLTAGCSFATALSSEQARA